MSLEDKLDELIVQATRIADLMESPLVPPAAKEKPAAKASVPNIGKDVKTPLSKEEDKAALKEPLESAEPVTGVSFDQASKYFFGMLTQIKEHKGLPVAKKVCADFMKKYTGDKPVNLETLPEDKYDEFYQEVQRVRAQHGIED